MPNEVRKGGGQSHVGIRLSGMRDDLSFLGLERMDIHRDKGHDGVSPGGHKGGSEGSGALDRSQTGSGHPP